MSTVRDYLIRFFFERMPLVKSLNGYKRQIGRVMEIASLVLAGLAVYYPEYALIEELQAGLMWLMSRILKLTGELHAVVKAKDEM